MHGETEAIYVMAFMVSATSIVGYVVVICWGEMCNNRRSSPVISAVDVR
jgi:hypothetical protein